MQKNNQPLTILPPQTIGIIGGGQLGRMMSIAAKYMGYQVIVLDPTPNCPTAQVADGQIIAKYDDMEAIRELSDKSDVVTYEFENVDLSAATYIEEQGKLPQGAYALEVTQNREKEKMVMKKLELPVPAFEIVHNGEECRKALESFSLPAVIKTCQGGYDGKGQLKIESVDDVGEAVDFAENAGVTCIIEEWVSFDKEISVIFSRSQSGEIAFFPISENEHRDHILYKTMVPAGVSDSLALKARNAARELAEEIGIVGTFAIEMFVKDDDIYLNEMAPRPHNSGHYSIEACNVSQFASHIRTVCGLAVPKIEQLQPAVMVNVLGNEVDKVVRTMLDTPEAFVHLYGKAEVKEKRKMGHVTFLAEDEQTVNDLANDYERR